MLNGIGITFDQAWWIWIPLLLALFLFTVFVYRRTVPPVSLLRKIILVFLRTLAFGMLVILLFEPVVTVTKTESLIPKLAVFIDNSESISFDDGTRRDSLARTVSALLQESFSPQEIDFYSFGSVTAPRIPFSPDSLLFDQTLTNYERVIALLQDSAKQFSGAVIISDGVITDGSVPVYTAERLGMPIYSVLLGDTVGTSDIGIDQLFYNEIIPKDAATGITASIKQRGYRGKSVTVDFYEEARKLGSKTLLLESDLESVSFDYTPRTEGEKKLTIAVTAFPEEFTAENNRRSFYVSVISNKANVYLIAGAPSSDVSFFRNALLLDTSISFTSTVLLNQDTRLGEKDIAAQLQKTDILYLINFPSSQTPSVVTESVAEALRTGGVSYFFLLTPLVDGTKFSALQSLLPFGASKTVSQSMPVQPFITEQQEKNPLLQVNPAQSTMGAGEMKALWENLPPVQKPAWDVTAKPESEVVFVTKINGVRVNTPLFVTKRFGSNKGIALLAGDVWRWKLQTAPQGSELFDRFVNNTLRWLHARENKKNVTIRTDKKFYSRGETVYITAEVFDETFVPVNYATVKVIFNGNGTTTECMLNSAGPGLYSGSFIPSASGDYSFSGTAVLDTRTLGSDAGRISIGELRLEFIDPSANPEMLRLLSSATNGRFYTGDSYEEMIEALRQTQNNGAKEITETREHRLRANEWILAVVVLLFAIEWFLRKRAGML